MFTVTLSDGKERELNEFTLYMMRELERTTKKAFNDCYIEEIIAAGLVEKDKLTVLEITKLIKAKDLPRISVEVFSAVAGRDLTEEVKKAGENPTEAEEKKVAALVQ